MIDNTIQYVVKSVGQILQQEIKLVLEAKGEVEDLASQLSVINAFLKNSEGKRDENHVVRELMQQIRDVAEEAEDVIEEFMLAAKKRKKDNMVSQVFNSGSYVAMLSDVAKKTEKINKSIDKIYSNFQLYGISMNAGGESSDPAHLHPKISKVVQRRRRYVEKDMVGRDDEVEKITKKLTTGRPELDFVSLVGMGGLGKTTLARKIYDDMAIRNHFTYHVWVFVSEEYNTHQVILDIMKTMMPVGIPEALEQKSEEELKGMLRNCLKSKRYLVVLDDIWKPETWDEISQCFPDGDMHSRIMITTRYKKVADRVCPDSYLSLRPLSPEEGWKLFSRNVLRRQTLPHDLQQLGKEIVDKCKGLPLSIVVVAGLLAGEKAPNKWRRTRDNVNSILAGDGTINEILALSYHDLPRELKPCFLYFAAFPEDFKVPARQLIRLWVGEGLMQKGGSRRMEDIAEDYLENLIDRGLVQAEKFRMDGGVKTCRIHDLLREFCINEAAKENFLESRKEVNPSTSSTSNPRRLSVQCNGPNFIMHNSSTFGHVRSIQSFDLGSTSKVNKNHWEKISEGKLLRVLDFGSVMVEEVPNAAEDLLNLRYLKINAPSLRKFPTSLVGLWNLQTLDMRSTKLENVPDGIYEIQNLRHLFLSGAVSFPKPSSKVPCPAWSLQTLSTVAPGQGIATLIEKGVFASTTRLGLCDSSPNSDWSLLADLHKLQNLESLKIASKIDDSTIKRMADCNRFPASLIKVTLSNIRLNSMHFAMFGELPNLQILKLFKAWGHLKFQKNSFRMIQAFSMAYVMVESWVLEEGALSHLEHLLFDTCTFSCELPHDTLAALAHLKSIHAERPYGKRLDSLKTLEDRVKSKCSVVIRPENWNLQMSPRNS